MASSLLSEQSSRSVGVLRDLLAIMSSREKAWSIVGIIGSLFSSVLDLVTAAALLPVVSVLARGSENSTFPILTNLSVGGSSKQKVVLGLLLVVVLTVFRGIVQLAVGVTASRTEMMLSERIGRDLLVGKILTPFERFASSSTSSNLVDIQEGAAAITAYGYRPIMALLNDGVFVLSLLIFIFAWNFNAAAALTLMFVAGSLIYLMLVRKHLEGIGIRKQNAKLAIIESLMVILGSMREIRVRGTQTAFLNRFDNAQAEFRATSIRFTLFSSFPRLLLETSTFVGLFVMVLVLVASGQTLPEILSFVAIVAFVSLRILPTAMRITGSLNGILFGRAILRATLPVIRTLHRVKYLQDKSHLRQPFRILELQDVQFRYQDRSGDGVVEPFSFTINRGDFVGIAGPSGSGKSTLLDLMLGLLSPTEGRILINGFPLEQGHLLSEYVKVGYVPQTVNLFSGTLRQNLFFGLSESHIEVEAVSAALKKSRLEEFVNSLDLGLETLVSDQGAGLSGGQRQRLGIARALLLKPSFLVMDEPTAALDEPTARALVEDIVCLGDDLTTVLISHNEAHLKRCTKVIRLG